MASADTTDAVPPLQLTPIILSGTKLGQPRYYEPQHGATYYSACLVCYMILCCCPGSADTTRLATVPKCVQT
jgi:hypothetical protein